MGFTITSDNIINLFWILIGVGLTLIGVAFTEWLKDRKLKQRLINALYEEARFNIKKARANKKISSEKKGPTPFFPFYTIAYEQYKLALMVDEKQIPGLSDVLVNAYTVAEMFNRKIGEYEINRIPKDEKLMFEEIENLMIKIYDMLNEYIKEEKLKKRSN